MAGTAQPKISVIIPSYNSHDTLAACVSSVLATAYRPLEVIVVDDCSTDNSAEIAAELVVSHADQVRLVHMPENRGPASARNAGARQADGTYLFFVDSDTLMLPDALHRFVRRIEDSAADAVSGIYHAEPLNCGLCVRYKAMLNNFLFSREGVFEYEVFNGAVAGVRRSVFEELKGYDENIRWGMDYENEELGHRMHAGHKMLLDPSIMVQHAFPNFGKATRTYFWRVSQWAGLFVKRRRFEGGGPATGGMGAATLSIPCLVISLPLIAYHPIFIILSVAFLGIYLKGYGPFLAHVARRQPAFLPTATFLNIWFCLVITSGAVMGTIGAFVKSKEESEMV